MKKKLIFGLIFLLLAFGFLEAQYHFFLRANRFWDNNGNFSTDGLITSIGVNVYTDDVITTRGNGLRLAYSGGRYTEMVANDEGEFEITKTITRAGENESSMQFWTEFTGQDESRKGVINIWCNRSNVVSSPGGSPDMAMQIYIRNEAASPTNYHIRAIEAIASNKTSGATLGEVIAAYFSAESRSGTTSTDIKTVQVNYDQSGNSNTTHTGLYVFCNSQSYVGTNYGIQITTSEYVITREYGLFIDSNAGSWTNAVSFNGTITNAFDFEDTNGTNAAGYNASYVTTGAGAVDGYIKVDVGGNTLYIYLWPTIPST